MEKKSIIDELISQAQVYLDEKIDMTIETITDCDMLPEHCSQCGQELTELYCRPEKLVESGNAYDLVVLKCQNCNVVAAFYIEPIAYDDLMMTPSKQDEYLGGRTLEPPHWKYVGKPKWGEGEQPLIPKKCAEAYKNAISKPEEPAQLEELDQLIQSKFAKMFQAGLDKEINSAKRKTVRYLNNNPLTPKQLRAAFAAAIYNVSQEKPNRIDSHLEQKEPIPERDLEKIFGITRKTIRRWRKLLAEAKSPFSNDSSRSTSDQHGSYRHQT
ncbi:MAG: hypothetical protein ABSB28_05900 [Candidatus Bathyarchaeia archaeon]